MKRLIPFILLIALFCSFGTRVSAQGNAQPDSIELKLREAYTKREVMIPMRDGVKLYTAIYEPKDNSKRHPILMRRTPYSCRPYGDSFVASLRSSQSMFVDKKYILVFQDVRGRHKSEGHFEQIRPLNKNKKGKKDKKNIDEATDTYDTIEWLIKNTYSNGNVGTWGVSYDGFYATMTASSNHPALKAVSPQAPVTDWFRGDDRHHNGAFTFLQTTNFLPGLEGRNYGRGVIGQIVKNDVYTDFLALGTFKNADDLVQDTAVTMWTNIKNHPTFDEFWKERDARSSCYNLKPAILVVGGLYDSEDCYGAWGLYKAIKEQSPETELYLTFGPWWHGAWSRRGFQGFGNVYFGKNTSDHYLDNIQYPFFRYYLENEGEKPTDKVNIFYTGKNEWETYDEWPIAEMKPTPYYIHANGSVSTEAPKEKNSFTEYVSDMSRPVPYTANPTSARTKEFMLDDQRFATSRPDVITFVTEPLTDTLTLAGPIEVEIKTAIESTDADFMVKVIDVYPEKFSYSKEVKDYLKNHTYPMSGFQQLVRGELFRGRFRTGFDNPQPFTPNEITPVNYTLYDVAHSFLPGHRLMIQIQSSWFPIIDRNPQKFIDTYHCTIEDFFMKQNIKIFHQENAATRLLLPVVKK
ncbi:MAG: CocE/NonD family hydrolase [Parabacteroides sp.]|nr:CocE/NonD family hydrolase [Parabacteroides sp.]